jgi:hypothetical protein
MHKDINFITKQFFLKEDPTQVSEEDLTHFVFKYPYSASARFLLAKKKFDKSGADDIDVTTAGLYFNNPLWYNTQLTQPETEPEPEVVVVQEKEHKPAVGNDKPAEESTIEFQSYHTIDYFASQGIRLQQADLSRDRLGQQLKSFTEWLRSMKKLPSVEGNISTPEDATRQQGVIQDAASSIEEKDVVTEAMAEVWLKQGNNIKAMEIYEKLSLQTPSQSAYFAAKIEQLK